MRQETQQSIADWADHVFGPAPSNARIAARANEEMAELLRVLTAESNVEHAITEAADVVIILYRLAEVNGLSLEEAIDRKMAVNRRRQWEKDGTGHGYHVRKADAGCRHVVDE